MQDLLETSQTAMETESAVTETQECMATSSSLGLSKEVGTSTYATATRDACVQVQPATNCKGKCVKVIRYITSAISKVTHSTSVSLLSTGVQVQLKPSVREVGIQCELPIQVIASTPIRGDAITSESEVSDIEGLNVSSVTAYSPSS